jgi:hypothetical protein
MIRYLEGRLIDTATAMWHGNGDYNILTKLRVWSFFIGHPNPTASNTKIFTHRTHDDIHRH